MPSAWLGRKPPRGGRDPGAAGNLLRRREVGAASSTEKQRRSDAPHEDRGGVSTGEEEKEKEKKKGEKSLRPEISSADEKWGRRPPWRNVGGATPPTGTDMEQVPEKKKAKFSSRKSPPLTRDGGGVLHGETEVEQRPPQQQTRMMDQLSEEVRQESPWTMMFADDIVICSESREQMEENLERWRFALERRGMKVSRSKTEYMCANEREGSGTVRLQGEEVKKVQEFKYLGSTVQSNGECGKEVKKRVQAGWNGWRKVTGVLCDRKISARIKGKVYKTVVRPAMLYGQ
ncbi:hypothetical protein QTP70_016655, partial [Hemibagrus guttatus]